MVQPGFHMTQGLIDGKIGVTAHGRDEGGYRQIYVPDLYLQPDTMPVLGLETGPAKLGMNVADCG